MFTDVGWWCARLGHHQQAVTLLQQALDHHQELGNLAYQAHTWSCLGETYAQLGDFAHAIVCYQHAVELFQDVGDRYGEASALTHLATHHEAIGDAETDDVQQRARDLIETLDPPAAAQLRNQLCHSTHTAIGDRIG